MTGKAKIIRVTSCVSCPLMSVAGDAIVCNTVLGGRKVAAMVSEVMRNDPIPEWCPLLDEEALLGRRA